MSLFFMYNTSTGFENIVCFERYCVILPTIFFRFVGLFHTVACQLARGEAIQLFNIPHIGLDNCVFVRFRIKMQEY